MLNVPNRTNLRRFWRRYTWPLAFLWWTITMWITKPRRLSEERILAIWKLPAIPRYQYVKDKPFDFMRHPRRIGLRQLAGEAPGDCDDYASWRAWRLLRDGVLLGAQLEAVWIMIIHMHGQAHAIVVAENHLGSIASADYGAFETEGMYLWTQDRALEIARSHAERLGRRGADFYGCTLARVKIDVLSDSISFHGSKVVLA
jgi:hypothetical protein